MAEGSLYSSVSGISIVTDLLTPKEDKLRKDADVFVRVGAWLAGRLLAQEKERNEVAIGQLKTSMESAQAIIDGGDTARNAAASQAQKRFINDGLKNFNDAQGKFALAGRGLEAAAGGRSQVGVMGKRIGDISAGGGKYFDEANNAQKAYLRLYDNLQKADKETAVQFQRNVTSKMSAQEKLQEITKNFYAMSIPQERTLNSAYKTTIVQLEALKNKNIEAGEELIKKGKMEKDAAREVRQDIKGVNQELTTQINTIKSIRNVTVTAKEQEANAVETVNEEIRKATELLKANGFEVKKLEQANTKLDKIAQQLAMNVKNKLTAAFQNYRTILLQTTMTLSVLWWRTSRVTSAFIEFDKELINAQSIWQTTNDQLYQISNEVVNFGTKFGIQYNKSAEVLYQFASAGLSASDALAVLNDTLKLSMAVQGDANTLGKLLVQVIAGFGLEISDSTELTDKFAHAINKSLIEWQDLASSVKFAMPFFVAAGQSVDQLLGALQILTNRALEAGIAGRGLRQALAEFTQHAEDNQTAFRKLGVEILNTDGQMRELTDIAQQFNATIGEGATDMDVMIALMEDLNIRGATAFIHLAQSADEFTAAVNDLENSAGAAAEMAEIQQQSLANQIQILKNAIMAPFLLADPMYVQEGYMNAFHEALVRVIDDVKILFYEEMPNGQVMLTETGFIIRDFVIRFIERLGAMIVKVGEIFLKFTDQGYANIDMLKLYFFPLTMLVYVLTSVPPEIGKVIFAYYLLNKALALNGIIFSAYTALITGEILGMVFTWTAGVLTMEIMGKEFIVTLSGIAWTMAAIAGSMILFGFAAVATYKIIEPMSTLAKVLVAAAAAWIVYWAAMSGPAAVGTVAAMAVGMLAAGVLIGSIASMVSPHISIPTIGGGDTTSYEQDYEAYMASFEGYTGPEAFNAAGGETTLVVDTLEVTGEANMDAAQAFYNATLVTE